MSSFPWTAVYNRLSRVRDDDLRSEALLIAADVWERRTAAGKPCTINTLCWRALQTARRKDRRRVARVQCADCSLTPERVQDHPAGVSVDWTALTDRQAKIARMLMDGRGQCEIAAALDCSQPTVCREIERLRGLVAAE